jgi:pyrrolysine biosynthesis protein PylD
MTRLSADVVLEVSQGLRRYDRELMARTGQTLLGIACRAGGATEEKIVDYIRTTRVAVVSITSGMGIIEGFAGAVQSIIRHLGFEVFVPDGADVAGIVAAIEGGAHVVFVADDERFVAINLPRLRVVDNTEATAKGYVIALEGLVGELSHRDVLVIGAGRVGSMVARILDEIGAHVAVFDRDPRRAELLAQEGKITVEKDLEQALQGHTIVVDATPASGIIQARHIKPKTVIAAPGIPLGLSSEARFLIGGRLIHDPLQIGVATMMILAVRPSIQSVGTKVHLE